MVSSGVLIFWHNVFERKDTQAILAYNVVTRRKLGTKDSQGGETEWLLNTRCCFRKWKDDRVDEKGQQEREEPAK